MSQRQREKARKRVYIYICNDVDTGGGGGGKGGGGKKKNNTTVIAYYFLNQNDVVMRCDVLWLMTGRGKPFRRLR